jgi:hypothetical protein
LQEKQGEREVRGLDHFAIYPTNTRNSYKMGLQAARIMLMSEKKASLNFSWYLSWFNLAEGPRLQREP